MLQIGNFQTSFSSSILSKQHQNCSSSSACPTWFVCKNTKSGPTPKKCQCGPKYNEKTMISAVMSCYCVTKADNITYTYPFCSLLPDTCLTIDTLTVFALEACVAFLYPLVLMFVSYCLIELYDRNVWYSHMETISVCIPPIS